MKIEDIKINQHLYFVDGSLNIIKIKVLYIEGKSEYSVFLKYEILNEEYPFIKTFDISILFNNIKEAKKQLIKIYQDSNNKLNEIISNNLKNITKIKNELFIEEHKL